MSLFASMYPTRDRSTHWNRESVCGVPAIYKSTVQSGRVDPSFSCPLGKGLNATVKAQSFVNPLVIMLRLLGGPYAIIRRIAQTVIQSFQRMTIRRPMAHVSNESIKGCPLFAHGNSTPAVIFIAWVCRVLTSLVHRLPCNVFGLTGHAVFSQSLCLDFFMQATAGNVRTPHEGGAVYRLLVSAFAHTQPIGCLVANEGCSYCSETARFMSRKVLGWHESIITF